MRRLPVARRLDASASAPDMALSAATARLSVPHLTAPMTPENFMREAIKEAEAGMRGGRGGPFGCVIVRRGEVIARGQNRVTSTNDPTAHAEVTAIRQACAHLGTFQLADCELYTSCEPCPMCLAAIYWARLARVFYANTRADAAAIGFDDDYIYQQIPLAPEKRALPMLPLLRQEAQAAFREWQAKPDKIQY
jgi:tRNA(Arg) A34 adenosine deaminase TadA